MSKTKRTYPAPTDRKPHLVALGKALAKRRRKRGLTRRALAEKAGLSLATVQTLEGGYYFPLLRTILALASALKIRPGWFYKFLEKSASGLDSGE